MSKNFDTTVTISTNATIDSNSVAKIIEKQTLHHFCGEYRFSTEQDVVIKIRDNESYTVREANEEEVKLYDALWMVYEYFKKLK